jgi:hypothetical protein
MEADLMKSAKVSFLIEIEIASSQSFRVLKLVVVNQLIFKVKQNIYQKVL